MNYRFRKPELIPTLATILVVLVTFGLAIWQLQRLEWKQHLLAQIEEAQTHAPRDIKTYTADTIEQAEWQNVIATGRLQYAHELHVTPRFYNGILGYGILTPLAVTTPTGTQYVLINRGWVAPENKDASTRAAGNPAGAVTVEGAIRSKLTPGGGFTPGRFTPENNPDKNLWYWYDMPAISKTVGMPLLPIIIDATAIRNADGSAIKDGPKPFAIEITIRNDHLGYAITWFLIGLCAVGVYGVNYLERKKPN